MTQVAHNFKEKSRTGDVLISEDVDFSGLLLSEAVLNGLHNSGFVRPSPIQLKAIPLGRCGLDLIVQAKSGTGKTCVFSVIALESIATDTVSTQVLVLAPTREIAVQIWEVINSIGSAISGLACHTFIGGLPVPEDRAKLRKCHIAVGSPGRIKQLIECGALRTDSVRLFVLDEADKLLEESFQEQINWIYSTLPDNKQMLALSATYPEYLAKQLTHYMRNPTYLRLNITDPALLGIRQYHQTVPYHAMAQKVFEYKSEALTHILSSISFQQCLVFSNLQTRAQALADSLVRCGWPTACIAGRLDQKDRNEAMAKLKTYKCRILISTDLTSRGIDADKVNLVINLDVPKDHETYLHRIGRAGRFGAFGIAITLVSEGQEMLNLSSLEKRCNTQIKPVPDPIPSDLAKAESPVSLDDVVSTQVLHTGGPQPSRINQPISEISTKIPQTGEPQPSRINQQVNEIGTSEVTKSDVVSFTAESDLNEMGATKSYILYTKTEVQTESAFDQKTIDYSKMNGHSIADPKDSKIEITKFKHQRNIHSDNGKTLVDNKIDKQNGRKHETISQSSKINERTEINWHHSNSSVKSDLSEVSKDLIVGNSTGKNAVAVNESKSSFESAKKGNGLDEKQLTNDNAQSCVELSRDTSTGFELNLEGEENPSTLKKLLKYQRKQSDDENEMSKDRVDTTDSVKEDNEDLANRGNIKYNSDFYERFDTNDDCEYCINRLSLQKLKVNVPEIFKKSISYRPNQNHYTYQTGLMSLKAFCDNKADALLSQKALSDTDHGHMTSALLSQKAFIVTDQSHMTQNNQVSDKDSKSDHTNLTLDKVSEKNKEGAGLQEAIDQLLEQFDNNCKFGSHWTNRKTQHRPRKVKFSLSAEEDDDLSQGMRHDVARVDSEIKNESQFNTENAVKEDVESEKTQNVRKTNSNIKLNLQSADDVIKTKGSTKKDEKCIEISQKQTNYQKITKSSPRKVKVDYHGKFSIGHLLTQERVNTVNKDQDTKLPFSGTYESEIGNNVDQSAAFRLDNDIEHTANNADIVSQDYRGYDEDTVDLTINRNKSRYRHSSGSFDREEVRDSDVRESHHSGSEFTEDSDSDSDTLSSSSEKNSVMKTSHRHKYRRDKYRDTYNPAYDSDNKKDKQFRDSYMYSSAWLSQNHNFAQQTYPSNPMFPDYHEQTNHPYFHNNHGPHYSGQTWYPSHYNLQQNQRYSNYQQQYPWQPYWGQPQYMSPWQHHYGYSYHPYPSYNPYYPSNGFNHAAQSTHNRKSYKDNLESAYRMQRDYIQQMSKFHSETITSSVT